MSEVYPQNIYSELQRVRTAVNKLRAEELSTYCSDVHQLRTMVLDRVKRIKACLDATKNALPNESETARRVFQASHDLFQESTGDLVSQFTKKFKAQFQSNHPDQISQLPSTFAFSRTPLERVRALGRFIKKIARVASLPFEDVGSVIAHFQKAETFKSPPTECIDSMILSAKTFVMEFFVDINGFPNRVELSDESGEKAPDEVNQILLLNLNYDIGKFFDNLCWLSRYDIFYQNDSKFKSQLDQFTKELSCKFKKTDLFKTINGIRINYLSQFVENSDVASHYFSKYFAEVYLTLCPRVNVQNSEGCHYVLSLSPPIPFSFKNFNNVMNLINQMNTVFASPQPDGLLSLSKCLSAQLGEENSLNLDVWGLHFQISQKESEYSKDTSRVMVSVIPFFNISQLDFLFNIIRQQIVFNTLYMSCFDSETFKYYQTTQDNPKHVVVSSDCVETTITVQVKSENEQMNLLVKVNTGGDITVQINQSNLKLSEKPCTSIIVANLLKKGLSIPGALWYIFSYGCKIE